MTSSVSFDSGEFHGVFELFADGACEISNLELEYRGSFVTTGNDMTWTPTHILQTIFRPEVVAHYNTKALCGFTDWKIDEPKDVAGRFCAPNQVPSVGTDYQDRFQIESDVLSFEFFPRLPSTPTPFRTPLNYRRN